MLQTVTIGDSCIIQLIVDNLLITFHKNCRRTVDNVVDKKRAREKGVNSDPGVGRKELRPTH